MKDTYRPYVMTVNTRQDVYDVYESINNIVGRGREFWDTRDKPLKALSYSGATQVPLTINVNEKYITPEVDAKLRKLIGD